MTRKRKPRTPKTASLKHERKYLSLGYRCLFGIDEAGRGPWAGPVSAGAVCLPVERDDLSKVLRGVRDSKELNALQRESLIDTIKDVAIAWGIGSASAKEIDQIGIVPATRLAMRRALEAAIAQGSVQPDCLFIDDMLLPEIKHVPQVSLIEGDSRALSIAAASILAKLWRDAVMLEIDAEFPQYGFSRHKGYGTPEHQAALKAYGPSPLHRRSYRPVRDVMTGGA